MDLPRTEERGARFMDVAGRFTGRGSGCGSLGQLPESCNIVFRLGTEPPRNGRNVTRSMVLDYAFLLEEKFIGMRRNTVEMLVGHI